MSSRLGRTTPCVSGYKWEAKSPVRRCTLSSGWPGEEKPPAARLSGVEVSLSSAIKYLPLSLMNRRITGETVHCCLKASVPLIHVSPRRPPLFPFARPGHKPSQRPSSHPPPVAMSGSLYFASVFSTSEVPALLEWPNHLWWITRTSATSTLVWPLCWWRVFN